MSTQRSKSFFLAFGVGALLYGYVTLFVPQIWERFAYWLAYPVILVTDGIATPLEKFVSHRASYRELVARTSSLETANNELSTALIQTQALLNYQERVTELADFQQRYELTDAIKAKVLLKELSPEHQYFLINRGARDGVVIDMVGVFKMQLLGKVVEVHQCYSKLLLITDACCKVSVYTATGNHHGIVEGTNETGELKLNYISHLAAIKEGDNVISSGQGTIFPEGFGLGTIKTIATKEFYHEITVTPLIDIAKIDMCLLTNVDRIKGF